MTSATTERMGELTELWCAEQCGIKVEFLDYQDSDPWLLSLEWTQEYGNLHGADWAVYTWQFYGESVEECIVAAIEWCRGLLPFEACHACDGAGWYNSAPDIRTQCDECGGSGLACRARTAPAD